MGREKAQGAEHKAKTRTEDGTSVFQYFGTETGDRRREAGKRKGQKNRTKEFNRGIRGIRGREPDDGRQRTEVGGR